MHWHALGAGNWYSCTLVVKVKSVTSIKRHPTINCVFRSSDYIHSCACCSEDGLEHGSFENPAMRAQDQLPLFAPFHDQRFATVLAG